MKFYKGKISVVSCYEAKKTILSYRDTKSIAVKASNLAFRTGDNELNHGLRAKYEMKTHNKLCLVHARTSLK
jgi:hypothetical protein